MPDGDRTIAERVHAIVNRVAPQLLARTWYGMPAYADGKDYGRQRLADRAHTITVPERSQTRLQRGPSPQGPGWPAIGFGVRERLVTC